MLVNNFFFFFGKLLGRNFLRLNFRVVFTFTWLKCYMLVFIYLVVLEKWEKRIKVLY